MLIMDLRRIKSHLQEKAYTTIEFIVRRERKACLLFYFITYNVPYISVLTLIIYVMYRSQMTLTSTA